MNYRNNKKKEKNNLTPSQKLIPYTRTHARINPQTLPSSIKRKEGYAIFPPCIRVKLMNELGD
jgi:hypothetical protein